MSDTTRTSVDSDTLRVLLVEDNPGDARLMQELLREIRSPAMACTCVERLDEATAAADVDDFDVALLDLNLPDSDGLKTVQAFHGRHPDLPTIVLTGTDDEALATRAVFSGAQDYIVKGTLEPALLGRAIRYAIERQRAEQTVHEAERDWRETFASVASAVAIIDIDGTIRRSNKAMEDLTGRPAADLVGRKCYTVMHGLDEPITDCPIVRAAKSHQRESLVLEQGGRSLEVVVDPIYENDGSVHSAIHTVTDITDRITQEQALRESESRFRSLWNAIDVGVFLVDAESLHIVDANSAALRVIGLPREKVLGHECHQFICPNERGACPVFDRGNEVDRTECVLINARHHRIPILKSVTRLDYGGKPCLLESFVDLTDRMRAEEALSESETRFRSFFENAPEYCFMLSPGGDILDVNTNAMRMLGKRRDDVVGIPLLDLYAPESRSAAETLLHTWWRTGRVTNEELLVRAGDGTNRTVLLSGSVIRSAEGELLYFVAIQRDITERKLAEEREQHLKSVLMAIRNVNQLITQETDRQQLIYDICDRLVEARGYQAAWIILEGETTEALSAVSGDDPAYEPLLKAAQKGPSPLATMWKHEPSALKPVMNLSEDLGLGRSESAAERSLASILCRLSDEDTTYGTMCVSLDRSLAGNLEELALLEEVVGDISFALHSIDQRTRRIEAEARDKRHTHDLVFLTQTAMEFVEFPTDGDLYQYVAERFRGIVGEHAVIGVCDYASDTGVYRVRAALGLGTNLSDVERVLGGAVTDIAGTLPPALTEQLRSRRMTTVEGGLGAVFSEVLTARQLVQLYRVLGTEKAHVASFTRGGNIYGCVIILPRQGFRTLNTSLFAAFVDQATVAFERRQSEQTLDTMQKQLRQAQKMEAIGVLAGGIAHDFNNILGAIMGYTDLSLEAVDGTSRVHHNLSQVRAATGRAADLVRQILTFSRQSKSEKKTLDIGVIVKEALKLLRPSLPSTIQISQHIARDPGLVLADPTQIHQVLMNLCTNAAHAMRGQHGTIDVSLARVELDVTDVSTLDGIEPGPYLQLSVADTGSGMSPEVRSRIFEPFYTTKKVGEGTGMGLSVVHGIVQDHGGTIAVESAEGEGATFRLFFPVDAEARHEEPAAEEHEVKRGGNERVLFVDDEQLLVDLGMDILTGLGYVVYAFSDSELALNAFKAEPNSYDIIVTDLTMPHLTGLQLAEEARAHRPDIPIVLVTGYTEAALPEAGPGKLVQKAIMKPLTKRALGDAVSELIDADEGASR